MRIDEALGTKLTWDEPYILLLDGSMTDVMTDENMRSEKEIK
jgi:hypothetical protein